MNVCFLTNPRDIQCAVLGMMGFSSKFIQAKTKLTPYEISYRLKKAGIKMADYRYGRNAASKAAFKTVKLTPMAHLASLLSKELGVKVIVGPKETLRLKAPAKYKKSNRQR